MKEDPDKSEFIEQTALGFFARHLDGLNYPYHQTKNHPVLMSSHFGQDLYWDFNMIARANGNGQFCLSVNSFIPNRARLARRAAMAELICRINCELEFGCFEFDCMDGGIRFRTNIILPATDITAGIVEQLLRSNLSTVDERVPQLMDVLYAGVTPEEAVTPPETDNSSPPRFNLN